MKLLNLRLAMCLAVLLFSAASLIDETTAFAAETAPAKVVLQEHKKWEFKEDGVTFNNQFPGARVNECTRTGKDEFRILIKPENEPVNNSPWYAFQVIAKESKPITVHILCEGGTQRYLPKTSRDGRNWEVLGTNDWKFSEKRTELTVKLTVDSAVLWVSAQEIITEEYIHGWYEKVNTQPYIIQTNLGKSFGGRDIEAIEINDDAPPNYIFIIGRQHPPEVTGSLGLLTFVETLTVDSPVAEAFRDRFRVFIVPMMNPDGVEEGQWRHNLGGVDLNRDWVKFAQPETRAVRDAIEKRLKEEDAKAYLFLDFHSTNHDIFYTQPKDAKVFPAGFTDEWLAKLAERFPNYEPKRDGAHNVAMPTSKYWAFEKYGVTAITFEFGDNTERDFLRQFSRASAEEMMKLMLEAWKKENP